MRIYQINIKYRVALGVNQHCANEMKYNYELYYVYALHRGPCVTF